MSGRPEGGGLRARVEIRAPAKVNLRLRVLERDDATGYHRLDTLFQAVGLCDRLVVDLHDPGGHEGSGPDDRPLPAPEEIDDVEVDVRGADLGPLEENLVTRAARAFLRRASARASLPASSGAGAARLRIRLEKRIPAGAGLGGGSSDAAATLRALSRVFGEPLGIGPLRDVAASLGSDVPFFLCGSPTARAGGRGDLLLPLPPLPASPVLLILPDVHVETGEAYRALERRRAAGGPEGTASRAAGGGRHGGVPRGGGGRCRGHDPSTRARAREQRDG